MATTVSRARQDHNAPDEPGQDDCGLDLDVELLVRRIERLMPAITARSAARVVEMLRGAEAARGEDLGARLGACASGARSAGSR